MTDQIHYHFQYYGLSVFWLQTSVTEASISLEVFLTPLPPYDLYFSTYVSFT